MVDVVRTICECDGCDRQPGIEMISLWLRNCEQTMTMNKTDLTLRQPSLLESLEQLSTSFAKFNYIPMLVPDRIQSCSHHVLTVNQF